MAARRVQKIRSRTQAKVTNLADPTVSRAVDEVRDAAQAALDRPTFQTLTQDLSIGTNAVQHGLGRAPSHIALTPSVASTSFAWSEHKDNPHPDRQVLIDVVGVAQPQARIMVS